ncbi:Hypothetical predicted protein [Xyrichtys novacula]|uniref:Uncharacterized protein n=1 Tax=Xyrichtys novacula TaxID=13765 RepID=A0AAV1G9M5_XYRNO|nr:Hypothetical predicted protein [Xyrichtys novacula]
MDQGFGRWSILKKILTKKDLKDSSDDLLGPRVPLIELLWTCWILRCVLKLHVSEEKKRSVHMSGLPLLLQLLIDQNPERVDQTNPIPPLCIDTDSSVRRPDRYSEERSSDEDLENGNHNPVYDSQ